MRSLPRRYAQASREALWAIGLAVAYFLWWYCSAYGLAPETDALPTLYFGLPLWFLLACVIGPLLFTVLCAVMVKLVYHDMPLDIEAPEEESQHD
uniref:YhdT family protein n=1 Tax=Thaumasiovibrio occultus TaxID=1891184 RepID=UPI000B350FCA|nr:YhdT family protein [Thaumasiovibrio occultus]